MATEQTSGVPHLAGRLSDTQCRSHISVAAELEMGLKQQALHLTAFGILLRLNLMEWELESARGCQPSLQRGEFEGGWSGDDGGRGRLPLQAREWSWIARWECRRQKWRCITCC